MGYMEQIIQGRIEAIEARDAIDYGLRSIAACNGADYCTGIHAGQLYRACIAAGPLLDRETDTIFYARSGSTGRRDTKARLQAALKIARECCREADAQLKDFGSLAQRRLLLEIGAERMGDTHEMALAA